jgi:hypothetical protein
MKAKAYFNYNEKDWLGLLKAFGMSETDLERVYFLIRYYSFGQLKQNSKELNDEEINLIVKKLEATRDELYQIFESKYIWD